MTAPSLPSLARELTSKVMSRGPSVVAYWQEKWLANMRENKRRFGSFADHSVGSLWGSLRNQPAVCAGAGPSLNKNMAEMWRMKDQGICFLSALHNYKTFEDRGICPDYYVSLDADIQVITDMSLVGKKTHAEYVESTKDKTLIAAVTTHPYLFDNWKGKVLLFNTLYRIPEYDNKALEIEPFYTHISTGGNVLGASVYLAKAVMGANPIALVGADFAYSYEGHCYPNPNEPTQITEGHFTAKNIYGKDVTTNEMFWGFKLWMDWIASSTSGCIINCTEGGIFGSYDTGLIPQVPVDKLSNFLAAYRIHEGTYSQCKDPKQRNVSVVF